MLIVLTGGARSGKSSLAVALARRSDQDVTFVATCPRIDGDAELERRIRVHREERPARWATIEAEYDLTGAIRALDPTATVVVDCLTLWVNNLLYRGDDESTIAAACLDALAVVASRPGETIAVTNEVGLGLVPSEALARTYRDVLGRVNHAWVAAADQALFLVAGRAISLHDPLDLLR